MHAIGKSRISTFTNAIFDVLEGQLLLRGRLQRNHAHRNDVHVTTKDHVCPLQVRRLTAVPEPHLAPFRVTDFGTKWHLVTDSEQQQVS